MKENGQEEVKRIRNCVPISARALAWTLAMIVFLLSSTMGTTVWAKRPTPPPPPPTYEFHICIGSSSDDDIYLVNAPLTVVTDVSSCGWYWPPNPGTKMGGWYADLNNYISPEDECGYYTVNLQPSEEVPDPIDATGFSIRHEWSSRPLKIYNTDADDWWHQPFDFWEFYISWGLDENYPEDKSNIRLLRVYTNWNAEPEGTYHPETADAGDCWEINFNGASWKLEAVNEDSYVYMLDEGTIEQDLWVTIVRGSLIP